MLCSSVMPQNIIIKTTETSPRVVVPTVFVIKASKYFFDSMIMGWKEAKSGEFCLVDIRHQNLQLFSHYVRKGYLDETDIDSISRPGLSAEEEQEYVHGTLGYVRAGKDDIEFGPPDMLIDRLLNAYLLGEYLQSPGFCNEIMDQITIHYRYFSDENDETAPLWNLELAFGGIRNSGLQRFVADVLNRALSEKTFRIAVQEGYLNDVVGEEMAAATLRDKDQKYGERIPWRRSQCTYHDHPSGTFNSPCHDPYSLNGREQATAETPWDTYKEFGDANDW